jgi:hypothetical protein
VNARFSLGMSVLRRLPRSGTLMSTCCLPSIGCFEDAEYVLHLPMLIARGQIIRFYVRVRLRPQRGTINDVRKIGEILRP